MRGNNVLCYRRTPVIGNYSRGLNHPRIMEISNPPSPLPLTKGGFQSYYLSPPTNRLSSGNEASIQSPVFNRYVGDSNGVSLQLG